MTTTVVKLCFIVLVSGLSLNSCQPRTAKDYVDKAARKMNRVKRGANIDTLLFKALRLDPTYYMAYIHLAENVEFTTDMTRRDWFDKKRYYYARATQIDSSCAWCWSYYAQTYRFEIERHPGNGTVETDTVSAKKAVALYDKAVASNSNVASFYYDRACCHIQIGDTSNAWRDMRKASSLGDRSAFLTLKQYGK